MGPALALESSDVAVWIGIVTVENVEKAGTVETVEKEGKAAMFGVIVGESASRPASA